LNEREGETTLGRAREGVKKFKQNGLLDGHKTYARMDASGGFSTCYFGVENFKKIYLLKAELHCTTNVPTISNLWG